MPQATPRILLGRFAAGLVLVAASLTVAQAQTVAPAPAAPPTGVLADPVFQSAQKRYEALPDPERRAIQEELMWTGDFSGAGSGTYGPLTFRAIQAFQKRAGATQDGYLQQKERLVLQAAAKKARDEVKFALVQDGKAGIRIGLPQALVPKVTPGKSGTRYASADGAVALETIAQSDVPLEQLFDRLKADQAGRKVTYKVLRPDWFVVAADQDGKRSYTRFAATPAGLKGFVFAYPVAAAATYDKIAVAIANSFDPGAAPAVAGGPTPPQPPLPPPPSPPPLAQPGAPFATGVVVAPGKVITVAAVDGCGEASIGGRPARVEKSDKASGLALLDVPGVKGVPASLRAGAAPADGAGLLLLAFAPASGPDPVLGVAPGEARVPSDGKTLRVLAALQKGGAGSPVFDRSGALVGLVATVAQEPRLVAGLVPAASYPVAGASDVLRIAAIQPATSPAGSDALTAGALAAKLQGSVVAIACRR
jgi:peptidoglycan hydrolase-like protein with peptidoglycan-binding domain